MQIQMNSVLAATILAFTGTGGVHAAPYKLQAQDSAACNGINFANHTRCEPFLTANGTAVPIIVNNALGSELGKLPIITEAANHTIYVNQENSTTHCEINENQKPLAGNPWGLPKLADVNDCMVIHDWALSKPGYFAIPKTVLDTNYHLFLAKFGTCAFGVFPKPSDNIDVSVGSADLAKAINLSIKYESDDAGHVEALDETQCDITNDEHNKKDTLYWHLSHP
ncbi:hypothetical protein CKAH01_02186 [Colletotrichum kahawae]|uniref:Ecp2 effector protein-like domain-containing protein n=1 Tax=Colletotrichum kahawae TaxID=34407 RepID=A0AAE0CZR0_COLKA|nr:hypothetical protein CKAH01_02186 [Colletotrichum kahawae]